MSAFWLVTALLCLVLQVALVSNLWKQAAYRTYPFVFAYVVALTLSSVLDWATVLNVPLHPTQGEQYKLYYWSSDTVHQMLCLTIMLSLIYRVMDNFPRRLMFVGAIVLALGTVTAVSIISTRGGHLTIAMMMTLVGRNLSFCSALLNMVLWSAILRRHVGELQLLMVSAGLGLQTTGKAIGHSLRSMAQGAVSTGDLIIVFTHIACLLVWWRAFRSAPAGNPMDTHAGGISSAISPNL